MEKHKKSGEDPKIRSMRVRAWVRAVKLASGLGLADLEEAFSQRLGADASSRSCIWDKYQRGEVVPRSRLQTKRGLSLVERVERRYPGTAKWLTSPLWRLADMAPMEMSEIREVYEGLPYLFQSIFIAGPYDASEIFWRRPVDYEHVYTLLLRQRDLDALVTILAMVKEAEITQDQGLHWLGVETARQCIDCLRHDGILDTNLLGELSKYLGSHWEKARYFSVPGEEDDKKGDEQI